MYLGAEEGRITSSYESGKEAYSSIKCRKYFDKLVDFQNHMGAPSNTELVNDRLLNILPSTISRTCPLISTQKSVGPTQPPIQSVL